MVNNIDLKVKRLTKTATLPAYATDGAAGLDLCADIPQPVTIAGEEQRAISTGIAVQIPDGYEGNVRPRSGPARKFGLSIINTPGTIDSDYRGEIVCVLINHSNTPVTIYPGDRIAQMVITPVMRATLVEVEDLNETERGIGGFGSTGGFQELHEKTAKAVKELLSVPVMQVPILSGEVVIIDELLSAQPETIPVGESRKYTDGEQCFSAASPEKPVEEKSERKGRRPKKDATEESKPEQS